MVLEWPKYHQMKHYGVRNESVRLHLETKLTSGFSVTDCILYEFTKNVTQHVYNNVYTTSTRVTVIL